MTDLPEPRGGRADPAELFMHYLDYYRDTVLDKVASLSEVESRTSRLPSGWTPLELLVHLTAMERRWFVWGFLGEDIKDPWCDSVDKAWHAPDGLDVADAAQRLREVARRTTSVLQSHDLTERAPEGPRFPDGDPATLAWICFHVLQEYARHAGHLDIVVELAGGACGE